MVTSGVRQGCLARAFPGGLPQAFRFPAFDSLWFRHCTSADQRTDGKRRRLFGYVTIPRNSLTDSMARSKVSRKGLEAFKDKPPMQHLSQLENEAQLSLPANKQAYGGFWIRFAAYVVDTVVLIIPTLLI